jgi:hypothetical protein
MDAYTSFVLRLLWYTATHFWRRGAPLHPSSPEVLFRTLELCDKNTVCYLVHTQLTIRWPQR